MYKNISFEVKNKIQNMMLQYYDVTQAADFEHPSMGIQRYARTRA